MDDEIAISELSPSQLVGARPAFAKRKVLEVGAGTTTTQPCRYETESGKRFDEGGEAEN
jgi:hypothetical protein